MLHTVTLTGADDSVRPEQLIELSKEFPFVEWGILIGSGSGSPRFPTFRWIRSLVSLGQEMLNHRLKLSLHICGRYLREIASGRSTLLEELGPELLAFDRCQLNWHGERQRDIGENILAAFCHLMPWEPQIIFQFDGVNQGLVAAASRRFLCSALFDASHGAGVLPREWPAADIDRPCGWAGGLGPDNVLIELPRIREYAVMPFWIDMETKVRTEGPRFSQFDLAKCRDVLEQCRPWVHA